MNSGPLEHLTAEGRTVASLFCTHDFVKATGVLAVCCLAALVGTFLYLRKRTAKDHYGLWGIAWLLYASGLALHLEWLQAPSDHAYFASTVCVSLCALLMFCGNFDLRSSKLTTIIAWSAVAATVGWAFWAIYRLHSVTWPVMPSFIVLAVGQVCAGVIHFRRSNRRPNLGVRLVAISFVVWGVHSAAFAFFPSGFQTTSIQFILTSLLTLLAVIGLVVEMVISRSELAVARSQMNYREILEAINDAIFIVDLRSLEVLDANRAARELTKRETRELVGCKFPELCPNLEDCEDSKSDPRKAFSAVFKPFRHFYIVRADGSTLTCEGSAKYVEWQNKSVMQVQVQQVADRGRVGELVRRADKMSALGQLIAGVAHELNNPLAVILGRSQILAKRANGPDRDELLKIFHESERAAKIVRDLLTFTRPCDPQFVPVDLNHLVSSVLDVFGPELLSNRIHLEKCLCPNLTLTKADSIQIEQVLTNLVKNAIYALGSLPSHKTLTVSTEENGTFIRIRVADNGPGVSEEIKSKIFEPFFTTKPPGKGTGLGLSICNNIIQDHRGSLWVENPADGGAAFVVELPVVTCAPNEKPASEEKPILKQAHVRTNQRALVVDDEPGMREVLQSIIASAGFAVDVAGNGSEALQKIGVNRYDVILADICMPEMDGERMYDIVSQKYPQLARRIIFVTGDMLGKKSRMFLERVGNRWIGKPFNISLVEEVINSVLAPSSAPVKPVTVPQKAQPPRPVADETTQRPAVVAPKPKEVAPSPAKTAHRVLVVDDEHGIRDVMQLTLQGCGYEVDTASNGLEGVQRVGAAHYDLILSDISMPGMDGGEFYDTVCRINPDLARRIIFVTGDAVSVKSRNILGRVQNRYITKPFRLDVLEKLVSAALPSTDSFGAPAHV